jgi:hypothetical protein
MEINQKYVLYPVWAKISLWMSCFVPNTTIIKALQAFCFSHYLSEKNNILKTGNLFCSIGIFG